jgi:hypothetical protein
MSSVLFFNVFMRHETLFQDKQRERVQSIVNNLPKTVGVLVCIELFDPYCQELFTKQLKEIGFLYRTASYEGPKHTKYHHGSGVLIFSKYPILEEYFHPFSSSTKSRIVFENYAHKGVVVAKIQLPNCIAYVCGTHLHSIVWKCFDFYREKQWQECMMFLESLKISWENDIVLIGGDMNQDLQMAENLVDMAFETNLTLPKSISGVSLDPENPLVGTELGGNILSKSICKFLFIRKAMLLDYVFSNQKDSILQVQKMQNSSDHYAVEWSSQNFK